MITLSSMITYYVIIGIGEGAITSILIASIQSIQPKIIGGFTLFIERSV